MDRRREMKEQSKKLQKTKKVSKKVDKEKLKVSVLRSEMLQVGKWKFEPTNEGDELVVKFFFIMKQLAWEVSRNGCRQKIEIEWSNIVGIKATLKENEQGTLKIELLFPPKFYKELKVDIRAHDKWIDGSDFTEDQASKCRRYLIKFPPGVLNECFERLINSDKRLYGLSQSRFPTFELAYFPLQTLLMNKPKPIQPSNQTLQPTQSVDSIVPQIPAFGLSSHNFDERMRLQDSRMALFPHEQNEYPLQPQPIISSEEAPQTIISMMGSSNNLQMDSLPSMPQYSQVPNGDPNESWPTNFSTISNGDLSNRSPAYPNEVSTRTLSNSFLSDEPICSNEVSDRCLWNGPTNSNQASNDYLSNRPTNSNGASNGHMFNHDSTYFTGVSNNYWNLPTDPRGVWLPHAQESEKED